MEKVLMTPIGYEHLRRRSAAALPPRGYPARVAPVAKLAPLDTFLAVPSVMAPAETDTMGHLLFALKHEGTDLGVLGQVLASLPEAQILEQLRAAPNSQYLRKAAYLWEHFNRRPIADAPPAGGAVIPLFDPKRYLTRSGPRDKRWRVEFNGLGTLGYCATVERTPAIEALLGKDILEQARTFFASMPPEVLDRATQWAYLSETWDSFAIEQETPSPNKQRRFMALLRQAHERRDMSEQYLVELQNGVVDNPLDQAVEFRNQQNHLANAGHGALGVTYVPPAPELMVELMQEWMHFANDLAKNLDPLVGASISSFGFVFIHPFMDGNGRLSRFLFHHALCRSGQLENGLLLPVSIAMKKHEAEYLRTLQAFSKPLREMWDVEWIDGDRFNFQFKGSDQAYRYWDATECVTFGMKMAEQALNTELRHETAFLARYDAIVKAVDERYDVRGSVLSQLVMQCLDNGGVISKNRRKQNAYAVPAEILDFIESQARPLLSQPDDPVQS
jgi:hypothetical protein